MAKLTYADLIERDQRARALAELGLRFDMLETPKLMPRLVDLVQANHLELLAESRSILGVDGYWLAEDDETKRRLIKVLTPYTDTKARRGRYVRLCADLVLVKFKLTKV